MFYAKVVQNRNIWEIIGCYAQYQRIREKLQVTLSFPLFIPIQIICRMVPVLDASQSFLFLKYDTEENLKMEI